MLIKNLVVAILQLFTRFTKMQLGLSVFVYLSCLNCLKLELKTLFDVINYNGLCKMRE